MGDANSQSTAGGRKADRVDLEGDVTIRFKADAIVGSGQNISDEGVFFLTEASVPVIVEILGRDRPLLGELVRLESMGSGQIGIAVKFEQPQADGGDQV